MREEICGRQNNLEGELNQIRRAIEEAAKQEGSLNAVEKAKGEQTSRGQTHGLHPTLMPQHTSTPTLFKTSMEEVTLEDVEIDTNIP